MDKYRNQLKDIVTRWRLTPLSAYDSAGTFIRIQDLETSLRGSLVLVYFQLKHYAIKNKKADKISSNTFSSVATQVKILQRAAERRPSPYKSLMLKGPIILPQSPSKKKDQIAATAAFHPGRYLMLVYVALHTQSMLHSQFICIRLQSSP
jgi:hypothetical protein